VLDDIDFFPDLSVAEHLELMAYAHGTADAVTVVEQTLSALGLDGARDQVPPTLSSGQRRRLALASCFVRPRRLLVLDEPEQRLDDNGRRLAAQLLQEKAGTAVIFASHDADLVGGRRPAPGCRRTGGGRSGDTGGGTDAGGDKTDTDAADGGTRDA
jgi:ABC-type multidrug transport system ATPase subunit